MFWKIRKFEITTSSHGQPAIQLENPTGAERAFLRRAVLTQYTDDVFYTKKQEATPFLQAESKDFMLVEFWKGGVAAQEFVDWLNSDDPEVVKAREFARWSAEE